VFETTKITMLLITSELDEAIYMGDTVYLLSTMPARVKKQLNVSLPRPRLLEIMASIEFAEIQTEAFETMEEEALKAFELVPA
jgi:NitT/TauT family transport system ATP-binding protein